MTLTTVGGGVTITRTASAFDPARLARIAALVDRRRGGVLSSGMEYPGRYTRWHLAYVNPPVEIATRGQAGDRPGAQRARPGPDAGDRATPCCVSAPRSRKIPAEGRASQRRRLTG